MNMKKEICIIALSAIATGANSFEIKPLDIPINQEFKNANIWYLDYDSTAKESCKEYFNYYRKGHNQPVHEVITRDAFQIDGTVLRGKSEKYPLLLGVQWNDDPENLLRGNYADITRFVSRLKGMGSKSSLTHRSHYGDLSFLHAMRPVSNGKVSSDEETHNQLMLWIENSYKVAIGEIPINTTRKETFFDTHFGNIGCGANNKESKIKDCKVVDVFDLKRRYRSLPDGEKAIQYIAAGSIAHIIQDSYSASHVKRVNGDGNIVKFYQYLGENEHCQSDAAISNNKMAIAAATKATAKFLSLIKHKKEWARAKPEIESIFKMTTDTQVASSP